MKKVIKIFIIYVMSIGSMYAQKDISYKYSNSQFFAGESVVFTDIYKPPILLPSDASTFTPTIDEIIQVEQLFIARYNEDLRADNIFLKQEKNVRKKYYKYRRQYLGYIGQDGSKNIIIKLLNFKHKKIARKNFEGWESNFFSGFGDYYEKNTRLFVINITYKVLKYW